MIKPFHKKGEKRKIDNGHWGCIYKTSIIKDNDIKFLHTKTGEDLDFLVCFYTFSKKIVMTSKNTCCLRMNPYSVTHGYVKNYYDGVLTCYTEFKKLYEQFPLKFRERAQIGLDAWHYYRCRLAIEREISHKKTSGGLNKSLKRIASDKIFKELYFNRKKLKVEESSTRWMKNALFFTMHHMAFLTVSMVKFYNFLEKLSKNNKL